MEPIKFAHMLARNVSVRLIAVSAAVIFVSGCVSASKRIPDPACDYCYRTESGIPYKTWEAYDP